MVGSGCSCKQREAIVKQCVYKTKKSEGEGRGATGWVGVLIHKRAEADGGVDIFPMR